MIASASQLELFQGHLDQPVSLALYKGIKQVQATIAEKTMRELIERVSTPVVSETKDTVLIGLYNLGIDKKRANKNIISVNALVFDIDDPCKYTFEDLVQICSKYAGLIHTTWTHESDKPRYRVIFSLTRPIEASNFEGVRSNFLVFNPELESIVDSACSDISRAYYLFSYPPERAHMAMCAALIGRPINPNDYNFAAKLPKKIISPPMANRSTLDKLPPLKGGVMEGGRNNALTKMIGRLINKGHTIQETYDLALEWNDTLLPPLTSNEVFCTNQSIWKTHLRNHPDYAKNGNKSEENTQKQFKLIPAADLLTSPPPPREWVIQDFLPRKIVGSIIAAGGTGKSYLAMHIATSVASGSSLFGRYLAKESAKVVFISGEDDSLELQRRLHRVTNSMPTSIKENINKNLHFIDLADEFFLFTEKSSRGEVSITDIPSLICNQIEKQIGEDIALVIIDPISRFRGGEENLAADTTRFVQALQQIRDRLNTTILTLHHVNKGSSANGNSQNNARGSSAFIDGVRLVYQLNALSDTEIDKAYGKAVSPPKLLTLQSVKSNYGKPIESIVLSRRDDGSLELFSMVPGDHQKKAILQEIKICGLSKTQFKDVYGGTKGKFSLAEKALLTKLKEYEDARLIKAPDRNPMILTEFGQKILDS